MLKKATFMNRNEKKKNIVTSLASRTPRFLAARLTRRSSGRGPRPHQDRGLCTAPPFQPRPLNASVRRQRNEAYARAKSAVTLSGA